jgi:DNA-binding transcriptional MerR regulator
MTNQEGDAMLLLLLNNLSPAKLAAYLTETFGICATTSGIVKYDNKIIRKKRPAKEGGDKLARRTYDQSDITLFNAVFVLRGFGYSIEEIAKIFDLNLSDPASAKECSEFIDSIKERIAKQKKSLELFNGFFDELKKKQGVH